MTKKFKLIIKEDNNPILKCWADFDEIEEKVRRMKVKYK
jgi:hypothetical protein